MSFQLTRATKAKLTNVNLRAEHHGDELKTGMDLAFAASLPNSFLDELKSGLLAALYAPAEGDEPQPGLEGVEPVANLPQLRFPAMPEKFGYTLSLENQVLEIDYGIGGASNIVLEDVKVNKLVLTLKEGGTIIAAFRVQLPADVCTPELIGRFGAQTGQDVHVLVYPAEETPNPMPFDADPDKPLDATDVFLASAEA